MMKKWKNLTNDTRYFIITGGRGSGKSFQVGRFAVLLSHYPNEKILYTRQTMTSAQLSIIPEIQEKINLMNRAANFEQSGNTLKNVFSGNEIVFKGLQTSSGDQTASLKSLTGVSCWVLDEAEELTDEAKFDKIDLSFRKKGVQTRIILILNPSSKAHWIYRRFFESKGVSEGFTGIHGDTTYIHTTYKDNERNLDQSFLNRANELKTNNPIKYNHIMLGGWLDTVDGVIYKNWKYGDFDDSLPFSYGMDFGFSPDPDVLIKVAIDNKRKVIYVKEEFGCNGLTPSELKTKVRAIVGRNVVIADCAEPRLIQDIKNGGVNIVAISKGTIIEGIKLVQDYEMIVHHSSTKIAEELNNYCEKNGKPIDMYNHRLDAIRYNLWHFRTKKQPTISRVSL
jgi:phage terminase large subunit